MNPEVRPAPWRIRLLLLAGFLAQGLWHGLQPPPVARAEDLPLPPPPWVWRLASLGEPVALAKSLMLWLQAYDYQSGVSLPFRNLDYARVEAWLDGVMALDPKGQYPLMSASRLYAEVKEPGRQRRMLEFIRLRFADDPNQRWPWLAHAALVAKHKLHDLPLALSYAREIRQRTTPSQVPSWARQLEWTVLEAMGELEGARMLIGGLLTSGEVTDPKEIHFLNQRLEELEGEEQPVGNQTEASASKLKRQP